MRYELFVSIRYLRARRREAFLSLITLISVVGVTISVATLDIALAVTTGFENDLRDRILGFNPHVMVTSFGGPIKDPTALLEKLTKVDGVAAAAPFIYSQAMVTSGPSTAGVYLRGVEPGRASDIVEIARYLRQGSFEAMGKMHEVLLPAAKDAPKGEPRRRVGLPGLVLGEDLREQLGVSLGDVVSVFSPLGTPSALGMIPRVRRFVIAGVFDSGMFEFDAGVVYASLAQAQSLLGIQGVSGIELRVHELDDASQIAATIEKTILEFPYEARDWMRMNRNVFVALRLEKIVYFLVLSLMLVVAGFSILATLVMTVMEKRKDIAILKSMGATDRSIASIFVFKGLVIGVLGMVAGNALGLALLALISRWRIPLPEGVFFVETVPVEIVPAYFAAVSAAAVIVCLGVTLYPAGRAASVSPVDVIRYE